jgi:hypothetical protein
MYTQRRVAEYLKRTTKEPKEPKISKKTKDFKKKNRRDSPMKVLLRSSLVVLMLLGGYAGFAASSTAQHIPSLPTPNPPAAR